LRQVERIFALDVPRRHVIAGTVTDYVERAVQNQGELGLGHVPPAVATDADLHAGAHHAVAQRLEEELRSARGIDFLVDVFDRRLVCARLAAAFVSDAARPDLMLAFDRGQQGARCRLASGDAVEEREHEGWRELEQQAEAKALG
jgi:hypothetical protein